MAFTAQWLLCLWQARAIRASWWAVLLAILTLLGVETLLMPPRRAVPQHGGWPELVRACITVVFMYFVCMTLLGGLWDGGRAMGTIVLLLAAWALLPCAPAAVPVLAAICLDVMGFVVGVVVVGTGSSSSSSSSSSSPLQQQQQQPQVQGWMHLVCALHLLLVSNRHDSISVWRMGASVVGLPLMMALYPEQQRGSDDSDSYYSWLLLLVLPSIGMHMQQLVAQYITPIVETLFGQHPALLVISHFWSMSLYAFHSFFMPQAGCQTKRECHHYCTAAAAQKGGLVLYYGVGHCLGLGLLHVAHIAAGTVGDGLSLLRARALSCF